MTPLPVQRTIMIALCAALISAALPIDATLAQSGSAGGSIGNDEKSLSGSRESPRAVESFQAGAPRPSRSRRAAPRVARKAGVEGGGGGAAFRRHMGCRWPWARPAVAAASGLSSRVAAFRAS
jgi:hypothetical protein